MPSDSKHALDEVFQIATAVDRAVAEVVPEIVDIQVAVAPSGATVISGVVPTAEAAERAVAAARLVPGVREVINSLTVWSNHEPDNESPKA